jgi:hypothetical protein
MKPLGGRLKNALGHNRIEAQKLVNRDAFHVNSMASIYISYHLSRSCCLSSLLSEIWSSALSSNMGDQGCRNQSRVLIEVKAFGLNRAEIEWARGRHRRDQIPRRQPIHGIHFPIQVQNRGTARSNRPPRRTGAIPIASPVASSVSTATPAIVAGPVAGSKRPDGIPVVKRRSGSSFRMPTIES